MVTAPKFLRELAASAGITINGSEPWDPQFHDERTFARLFGKGTLGLGEAYMDGWWDCQQLDEFFHRLLRIRADKQLTGRHRLTLVWERLRNGLINLQTPQRAYQVGKQHYDIGNDVFMAMLDSHLCYSCGYWAQAETLEKAQHDKLDLICRKLQLARGEHLLDIGCGWGSLCKFAAENYGVTVVGITISERQMQLAQERCAGLPVRIELHDYRLLPRMLEEGQLTRFDKIASVGMFEHVGPKNYEEYFSVASRLLQPEGLFLLHTIGSGFKAPHLDPWIERYIFPNGKLPHVTEIADALAEDFFIEDWHSFGHDYDKTLMAWNENFERAWPRLSSHYDQRFARMWRYYLLSCAGFFRSGQGCLWQIVLGLPARQSGYRSVR